MDCLVCGHDQTSALPWNAGWVRCWRCGGDTNTERKTAMDYVRSCPEPFQGSGRAEEVQRRELTENIEWFTRHRGLRQTFLDVGCAEGVALDLMRDRGWKVAGFDVMGSNSSLVTVGDEFVARDTFDAVMSREVVEHTPEPMAHVRELVRALNPHGLLQLQTPRPVCDNDSIVYQEWHNAIIPPLVLASWLERFGCRVIRNKFWQQGQNWLAVKVA